MIPDIEAIVTAHLKAELVETVTGTTPRDTRQAWVKVTQIDVRNVSAPKSDHFNSFHIQLDCYASDNGPQYQGEAGDLFRSARAAMLALPDETLTGAVVTAVTFGSSPRIPDTSFEPPRQRYVLDTYVYAHPA